MLNNPENIKVFISYKKREDNSSVAPRLAQRLEAFYDVFIDVSRLEVGRKWAEGIYANIHESDVLIVVIEKGAATSDWVQREVDVARGAHVSILPVRIGAEAETDDVVTKLALFDMQHFIGFDVDDDDNFSRLLRDIDRLALLTRENQKAWQGRVAKRRRLQPAPNNPSAAAFTLPDADWLRIHLATGDMTQLSVDVMVNSENNYMQMARFFDSSALSAALRLGGAHVTRGRIREDTLQNQLEHQLSAIPDYAGRPIVMGQVVPTYAGHPQSRLVQQGVRYVFHAATGRMQSFTMGRAHTWIDSDSGIRETVFNTLDMIAEVHEVDGRIIDAIDPPFPNDLFSAVESIALPVFGTGTGNLSFMDVVRPMLYALRDYDWRDQPWLRDVYLCIYPAVYVEKVKEEMQSLFITVGT